MASFMKPYEQHTYALMRIVLGAVFLWHGSQKLFGYPPLPPGIELPGFVTWVGGPVELFGGILIMLGLFTRWAAFICSGQMAVAYWLAHGTKHLLPQINGGELAVVYCFVFLYVAARGPGIWSVDAARGA
ncbi:MAG TPA: DoxX family protein [Myxococcota bacterium]|nr:DoxX family protein [Myxococcota bacterium]